MFHIAERNIRSKLRKKCFITWYSFIVEVTLAAQNTSIRRHERPENGEESVYLGIQVLNQERSLF